MSILARTWTADEGRYEEEQAALKALADARNTGMSRHGPTFVSYTKPDTGEPVTPEWCAGFTIHGFAAAAFGYGEGRRCVIQVKTPHTPEFRVVRAGSAAADRLRLRLGEFPRLLTKNEAQKVAVFAADEAVAKAFRKLIVVPYERLSPGEKDRVPESDRPHSMALADGVISIDVAAPQRLDDVIEYAKDLLELVRDVPDHSWRTHATRDDVGPGYGGRYFRYRPRPREQWCRLLSTLGLLPMIVVALAFGVAEIGRSLAYLTGAPTRIFTGDELPAIFAERYTSLPSSQLSANVYAVLGVLAVYMFGTLAVRLGRWVGIPLPALPPRLRSYLRRMVFALVVGVLLLAILSLGVRGWLALVIVLVIDVVVAGLLQFGVFVGRRLRKRSTDIVDVGLFALLALAAMPGAYLLGNAAAVMVGVGPTVEVTVVDREDPLGDDPPSLDVTYELGGQRKESTGKEWHGDRDDAPHEGDTLTMAMAPLWPRELFFERSDAWSRVEDGLLAIALIAGCLAYGIAFGGGRKMEPSYMKDGRLRMPPGASDPGRQESAGQVAEGHERSS